MTIPTSVSVEITEEVSSLTASVPLTAFNATSTTPIADPSLWQTIVEFMSFITSLI